MLPSLLDLKLVSDFQAKSKSPWQILRASPHFIGCAKAAPSAARYSAAPRVREQHTSGPCQTAWPDLHDSLHDTSISTRSVTCLLSIPTAPFDRAGRRLADEVDGGITIILGHSLRVSQHGPGSVAAGAALQSRERVGRAGERRSFVAPCTSSRAMRGSRMDY